MTSEPEELKNECPPGFRYRPPNEELYNFLELDASKHSFGVNLISEQTLLYHHDPQEIITKLDICPNQSDSGAETTERYIISLDHDEKYPYPYCTPKGYWEPATTFEAFPSIGLKTTLDFYDGNYPRGTKTGWKIHEYQINPRSQTSGRFSKIIHNKPKSKPKEEKP